MVIFLRLLVVFSWLFCLFVSHQWKTKYFAKFLIFEPPVSIDNFHLIKKTKNILCFLEFLLFHSIDSDGCIKKYHSKLQKKSIQKTRSSVQTHKQKTNSIENKKKCKKKQKNLTSYLRTMRKWLDITNIFPLFLSLDAGWDRYRVWNATDSQISLSILFTGKKKLAPFVGVSWPNQKYHVSVYDFLTSTDSSRGAVQF